MSWIDQRPDDAMDGAFTAVGPDPVRTGSGPTAVKAPSIASSGRWSIQLIALIPPHA